MIIPTMKRKIITTCSVLMAVLGFLGMETGLIISGFRVDTGIGFLSIFIVLAINGTFAFLITHLLKLKDNDGRSSK